MPNFRRKFVDRLHAVCEINMRRGCPLRWEYHDTEQRVVGKAGDVANPCRMSGYNARTIGY